MVMPMVTVTLPIYRRNIMPWSWSPILWRNHLRKLPGSCKFHYRQSNFQAVQLYQDAQTSGLKLYDIKSTCLQKSLDLMLKKFFSVKFSPYPTSAPSGNKHLIMRLKQVEAVADFNTKQSHGLKKIMANSQNSINLKNNEKKFKSI